jgi:hypothetical protein
MDIANAKTTTDPSMDVMRRFVEKIRDIGWGRSRDENVGKAREIVSELNRFLYSTHDGLGTLDVFGSRRPYFSEFHKFWEKWHGEVLDVRIDDEACSKTANVLHGVFEATAGRAFREISDMCGLTKTDYCRVRLLTGNQDFRGSRNLSDFAKLFGKDESIFDVDSIIEDPERFLKNIGLTKLSQNDKRVRFAKQFAVFVRDHGGSPIDLPAAFGNDLSQLREAMIKCEGSGYANKKTDMVIRDMVVHGVWDDSTGFDAIDVASDVNTIGIALRTGILHPSMPLVSSFLDEFCYQYLYLDRMNAAAWRRVWEIWKERFPADGIVSPCLLDFFIYNVIGRQFCKAKTAICTCENGHVFGWRNAQLKNCPTCRGRLVAKRKILPCEAPEGRIAIEKSEYVKSGAAPKGMRQCPFQAVCEANGRKSMNPPKSISILGQTGWETAYANEGDGGGGLMA